MEDIFGRRISRLHRVPPRPVQAPGLRRLNGYTRTRIRTHAHTHTHTHTHTHRGMCALSRGLVYELSRGNHLCILCQRLDTCWGGGRKQLRHVCGRHLYRELDGICMLCM